MVCSENIDKSFFFYKRKALSLNNTAYCYVCNFDNWKGSPSYLFTDMFTFSHEESGDDYNPNDDSEDSESDESGKALNLSIFW